MEILVKDPVKRDKKNYLDGREKSNCMQDSYKEIMRNVRKKNVGLQEEAQGFEFETVVEGTRGPLKLTRDLGQCHFQPADGASAP